MCGRLETHAEDKDAIINPILLIEVLSDSTEAYDRDAKVAHYRRIPSLREYVLVSQNEPRIEVYRRTSTVASSCSKQAETSPSSSRLSGSNST